MKRTLHGLLALVAVFLLHAPALGAGRSRHAHRHRQGSVRRRASPKAQVTVTSLATGVVTKTTTNNDGTYLVVNLLPGEYLVQVGGDRASSASSRPLRSSSARARASTSRCRSGSIGETVTVEGVTPLLSTESAVLGTVVNSNEMRRSCRWRSATGTTCWRWCPACRAIATPSRRAARRRAAPAASACTATAACRTTSCSTASPTTASRPTCRS